MDGRAQRHPWVHILGQAGSQAPRVTDGCSAGEGMWLSGTLLWRCQHSLVPVHNLPSSTCVERPVAPPQAAGAGAELRVD